MTDEITLPVSTPNHQPIKTTLIDRPAHPKAAGRGTQAFFSPKASAILHFMPSGLCLSSALDKPSILGRGVSDGTGQVIDLTELKAHELGVSRHHCQLQRRGAQLVVTDLGSSNGTYLNHQLLAPQQPYIVAHGDELTLGMLHLRIYFSTG